ncbi:MAG: hypothetical protein LPH21_18170 [Shewanella sp.]|nr:hypothetical protein [Shewanella sp.]
MQTYYSGQGIFSTAEKHPTTGEPMGFIDIGNVPEATIDIEVEKDDHKESRSGQRAVDLTIVNSKKGRLSMTVENFEASVLALGLHGKRSVVAAGSVADEPIALYHGKPVGTSVPKWATVPNVVVTDSTGTTTYVLDTDYTIDPDWYTVTALSGGAIADGEDCLIDYDHDAVVKLDVFTEAAPVRWVRFHGVNTVKDLSKKIVNIFKVQFDPITGYALIGEGVQGLDLQGDILYDETRAAGTSPFMNEFDIGAEVA